MDGHYTKSITFFHSASGVTDNDHQDKSSLQALIKNGYKNVNVVYRYRMKLSTHTD